MREKESLEQIFVARQGHTYLDETNKESVNYYM